MDIEQMSKQDLKDLDKEQNDVIEQIQKDEDTVDWEDGDWFTTLNHYPCFHLYPEMW